MCIIIYCVIFADEIAEDGFTSAFTALPRTKWAEVRERLMKDPVNKESIEAIQSAFQIYVLADEAPDADVSYVNNS